MDKVNNSPKSERREKRNKPSNDVLDNLSPEQKKGMLGGWAGFLRLIYSTELFNNCVDVSLNDFTTTLVEEEKTKFKNCITNITYTENMLNKTREKTSASLNYLYKHKDELEKLRDKKL